jgi:putative endonuclease
MTNDPRQALGISGEDLACAELQRRGYAIVERRYRTRLGEIDIIAKDGLTIVFVEVKARMTQDFGGAAAAMTGWKQRRIARMAADYLARQKLHDCPCRFDVVAIDFDESEPRVIVYPNAFNACA